MPPVEGTRPPDRFYVTFLQGAVDVTSDALRIPLDAATAKLLYRMPVFVGALVLEMEQDPQLKARIRNRKFDPVIPCLDLGFN